MPYLIALITALGAATFWYWRLKNAAEMASEVADMAQTVLGAARRFGFRRRANVHPVDSIEDSKLAIGGLATAFLELAGVPTIEERQALIVGLQSELELSLADAEEMTVLGHWFVSECGGALMAVGRLARKLRRLAGPAALPQAMAVIDRVARAGGNLNDRQREALGEIKAAFGIR